MHNFTSNDRTIHLHFLHVEVAIFTADKVIWNAPGESCDYYITSMFVSDKPNIRKIDVQICEDAL